MATVYEFAVPLVACVNVRVIADSEEDAKAKIWDCPACLKLEEEDGEAPEGFEDAEVTEWSFHEVVSQGNVYYGGINKIELLEIEKIDEDGLDSDED